MVAFSGANSYSGSPNRLNGEWDDVQHFLLEV